MPSTAEYDETDPTLRVAFDFDGLLADDSSERKCKADGLDAYMVHEGANRDRPLEPGLLKPLLADLNRIQHIEESRRAEDPDHTPRLRIVW